MTDGQVTKHIELFCLIVLQKAQEGIYKDVWDTNIRNKDRSNSVKYAHPEIAQRAQTTNFVFIAEDIHLRFLLMRNMSCDLRMADDKFYKSNLAIVAYKGFPYKEMFDDR